MNPNIVAVHMHSIAVQSAKGVRDKEPQQHSFHVRLTVRM